MAIATFSAVAADDPYFTTSGDAPVVGASYLIGSEIVRVAGSAWHPASTGGSYGVTAERGCPITTAAPHDAGAALTPVYAAASGTAGLVLAQAANVAAIATPGTATAEDAATAANAILTALKAAGLMAPDA